MLYEIIYTFYYHIEPKYPLPGQEIEKSSGHDIILLSNGHIYQLTL